MSRTFAIKLSLILIFMLLLGWLFSNIVLYIILSVVIFSILKPLAKYLSTVTFLSLKIPKLLAVLLSFVIFCGVIFLFVLLFVPLVKEQFQVVSGLNYDLIFNQVTAPLNDFEVYLKEKGVLDVESGFLVAEMKKNFTQIIGDIQVSNILNSILSITGNVLVGVMAVLFITFFLLYEMGPMRKRIISLIPNKYFEITIGAFNKIEKLLSNYLIGLILQMMAIFSIVSLGLSVLGIKYALTIAVFAAVANLIPYLGPILGAAFGIMVGVSTGVGLEGLQAYLLLIIKIISVFAVVQVTDNVVLQPLIFSKSVKAHPLEIFIVIFAGASLAGIPGMIAAIPAYTILRVSFHELYQGYKQYQIVKL